MPLNIAGLFKGKAKEVLDSAFKGLDGLVTSKEELAKIRLEAEQELNRHAEQLEANALKEMELQNANTSSARQRETELIKTLGRADYFQYIIGLVPVLGLPALVYYVMMYEIPQRNEHLAMLIIGEVLGFVAGIYNYYYGSSMGSRIKDMRK